MAMFDMAPTRDYRVRMPLDRWVRTACEDTRCDNWRYGWDTILDERTPLGRELSALVRSSGRTFREMKAPDGLTVFRFEPHQRCFTEHRTRPARLLVTQGRGLVREHVSFGDIAEDYTEHVGRLAEDAQKG